MNKQNTIPILMIDKDNDKEILKVLESFHFFNLYVELSDWKEKRIAKVNEEDHLDAMKIIFELNEKKIIDNKVISWIDKTFSVNPLGYIPFVRLDTEMRVSKDKKANYLDASTGLLDIDNYFNIIDTSFFKYPFFEQVTDAQNKFVYLKDLEHETSSKIAINFYSSNTSKVTLYFKADLNNLEKQTNLFKNITQELKENNIWITRKL
ncbi:MAG: hypothetical protein LRY26_00595 [Bacilli bacterium]|nr:hypothetical protein [Bacilli bacterium]